MGLGPYFACSYYKVRQENLQRDLLESGLEVWISHGGIIMKINKLLCNFCRGSSIEAVEQ